MPGVRRALPRRPAGIDSAGSWRSPSRCGLPLPSGAATRSTWLAFPFVVPDLHRFTLSALTRRSGRIMTAVLKRLEAREQIETIMYRDAESLDAGDVESCSRIFASSGKFVGPITVS